MLNLSSRRLFRIAWLLPVAAVVFFWWALFASPSVPGAELSGSQLWLIVVAVGLVPLAAVAGIFVCVIAVLRSRREAPGRPRSLRWWLVPLLVVAIALACVGLVSLIVWAVLKFIFGLAVIL